MCGYLAKLNVDDELSSRVPAACAGACRFLSQVDGFAWRTRTAVDVLEGLLEDLTKGTVPINRYAGQGLGFGYWSETMQRIEAIWVQVPPNYQFPAKTYQLFVYYKCGGGIQRGEDGRAQGGLPALGGHVPEVR